MLNNSGKMAIKMNKMSGACRAFIPA